MDIKSAEESFQNVIYDDPSFNELLEYMRTDPQEDSYHLCLFVGKTDGNKSDALQRIAENSSLDIAEVDANTIISKIESETIKKIDQVFENHMPADALLYLRNAGRLCGAYTGYTHSRVKYATPQERYFLKKLQKKGGLYVIDIDTETDADTTIRRAAQSIVNFKTPQTFFKRILWKLRRQVTVHGYEIKTDRPESYSGKVKNY
jgi:hypothetical protein